MSEVCHALAAWGSWPDAANVAARYASAGAALSESASMAFLKLVSAAVKSFAARAARPRSKAPVAGGASRSRNGWTISGWAASPS